MGTKIEWTDETWNPVTGCTKVSPGCDNCYAEKITERFHGKGSFAEVKLHPDRLDHPLRWRKPRRVFVNSMSDLFHEAIPDDYLARVFAVMALTPQHTYQILTKRHGRMRSLLRDECHCGSGHAPSIHLRSAMAWAVSKANPDRVPGVPDEAEHRIYFDTPWPLRNVWLGVSVEDQKRADLRIPALLDSPAAVRFLSCEPLLGGVDLKAHWLRPTFPGPRISWAIIGGESGPGARPMHPDWARHLRDQCQAAGVPFFFKQWGSWAPAVNLDPDLRERATEQIAGQDYVCRVGKKAAGRVLDGRAWDEYPGGAP